MEQINASIGFDKRLADHDVAGSKAHAAMLAACGIITQDDAAAIQEGLDAILREIEAGDFAFSATLEDIHLNIEQRLTERIGEAGKRLHTARSRNDQVATDAKLFVRAEGARQDALLQGLQRALIDRAEAEAATVMPGFTHLQAAQPVTFGHHLLAYVEMVGRDRDRFRATARRAEECPLGAAALAGTGFAIDRHRTAEALGFARPAANSLDAVSDRDFVLDFLHAASVLSVHLSRLAEEFVLWSTPQFGFVAMPEAFSSGSSIMPQKRNPDAAELMRGKTGRVIGDLVALLVTMKGLPLAYSKDMQEDKEPLFDAADTLRLTVPVATSIVEGMAVNRERMAAAAGLGHTTATDLADHLVRAHGVPFRRAHHAAAQAVKAAEARGCALAELPLDALREIEPLLTEEVYSVLTVERSVASRASFGGTAPERVREAVRAARERFLADANGA